MRARISDQRQRLTRVRNQDAPPPPQLTLTLRVDASYLLAMLILLTALAMFVATPAAAEFSGAERAELAKLFTARSELAYAMVVTANAVHRASDETSRPTLYRALQSIVEAQHDCFQAQRHLFNAAPDFPPSFAGLPRAQIVARAREFVATCQAKTTLAAQAMLAAASAGTQGEAATAVATQARRLGEEVELATFDTNLAFAGWRNESHPRVIGPHGDYDRSQLHIAGVELNLLEAMKDFIIFYGRVPVASSELQFAVREVLRYAGTALGTINRIWFIDNGQVLGHSDLEAIAADTEAGSGLRPESFFRFLREVELVNVFDHFDSGLAGRPLTSGITEIFALISDQSAQALYAASTTNTIEDLQTSLHMPAGTTSFATADAREGRIREFYQDFAEAWHHLDGLNAAWILFFHEIPAPPEMGVVCGSGTHLKGRTCVADPAPPCTDEVPAAGAGNRG